MADQLLQEVDAALRADRMGAMWAKHRGTIIACVVALIVGTAANSVWQHYRQARGGEVMLQLSTNQELLASGKAQEAADGFGAIAKERSGELRDVAMVWQARALVAAKQKDAAITVLNTASAGKSLWADIACLRLAGLDAAAAKPCLNATHDSPLMAERAQWAAADAWANGDADSAAKTMDKLIADPNTGEEARAQMMQWFGTIKAQQGKK